MSGITGFLMSQVYPAVKMIFDAGSRRITVSVIWNEGNKEQSLEVSQWVTSAGPVGLAQAQAADAAAKALDADAPLGGGLLDPGGAGATNPRGGSGAGSNPMGGGRSK
jgi:hypothetical protein